MAATHRSVGFIIYLQKIILLLESDHILIFGTYFDWSNIGTIILKTLIKALKLIDFFHAQMISSKWLNSMYQSSRLTVSS